jgi:hypothetical protein
MEPSHEVIAASGVDWSTATGVAAVVESPVALPELVPDGVDDVDDDVDDVDDDVVDAAGVVLEVVPVVPVALLQAASDTERARASATVVSFFMGGSLLTRRSELPSDPRTPVCGRGRRARNRSVQNGPAGRVERG